MIEPTEHQADKQAAKSRVEHLKPHQFKPGQSGNPGGKPKGTLDLKTRMRNAMMNCLAKKSDAELEEMTENLYRMAAGGGQKIAQQAYRELMDRIVGPVVKEVDLKDDRKVQERVEIHLAEGDRTSLPDIPGRN